MTSEPNIEPALSPTKQALLRIRELKRQLEDARRGPAPSDAAIAIVSMACRFPRRAATPEAFWENLLQGSEESSEIPPDRWDLEAYFDENPEAPGKMYARRGVFLDQLDQMDPEFFGISPREATWVDPQQRLLLEVAWEALERAGWPADQIAAETGFFVGWMHNDYQNEASDSLLNLNPYIATGSAGSFLCGRLSYYLGLQGPSLAVDTACSSSLVALHLACQSLLRGECRRALVGGVNAIVSPTTNILTCKLKALSPSGHSRAFDASADGYLRGEGCGVVAIRPLPDALADGDTILGVIRGSAIGHNGFSSGLTAPNPQAQERVIREALRRAGVTPQEIQYLEAHGTGTELGDPIEMQAAAAALGEQRSFDDPLLVGSVKTNIGHLEAAAGMAGLIKVLLAMQHRLIPPQLHFETPNPHIPWERLPVKIVVEPTAWSPPRQLAGLSAFGMSGTNAHVVLEGPPAASSSSAARGGAAVPAAARDDADPAPQLTPLSAKSEEALREQAARLRRWWRDHPQTSVADVAYTLGVGRRHFEHRAALAASSPAEAIRLLELLERGGDDPLLARGGQRGTPRVAWQFTGQGSQYPGMAARLYQTHGVFRDALDQCQQWFAEDRGESLLDVIFQDAARIHRTEWTQPALFAMQMGLARLLSSWGLQPDVVLGHSVGQYAAACVAGVMSWRDGMKLISARGRLIGDLPPGGAMVAVFASPEAVEQQLAESPALSIAAYNGGHQVISGAEDAVLRAVAAWEAAGVRTKRLTTSHAFHSSLMEPALAAFTRLAASIPFQPARIPLACNISGTILGPQETPTAEYWTRHLRQPVRYSQSIQAVRELGCGVLLEVGPQPVLTGMAAAVLPPGEVKCLATLRPGEPPAGGADELQLAACAAALYAAGVTPDFAALHAGEERRRLILPTYPFQRRRFWGPPAPGAAEAEAHTAHPLLGAPQRLAGLKEETRFQGWLSPGAPAWLADHQVLSDIVFPGAASIETALAAAGGAALEQLRFEQPLRVAGTIPLQTVLRKQEGQRTLELYSLPPGASQWIRHAAARIGDGSPDPAPVLDESLEAIQSRCPHTVAPADFYRLMGDLGLHYGPQFQTIRELHHGERDVLARLETEGDFRGYQIPPTLLDGAFHCLAVSLLQGGQADLFLPAGVERLRCHGAVQGPLWCRAQWREADGDVRTADLTLFDANGRVLVEIDQLQLRRLDRAALRRMSGAGAERLLYQTQWRPVRLPPLNTTPSRFLLAAPDASARLGAAADALQQQLTSQGHEVLRVQLQSDSRPGDAAPGEAARRIAADSPEQWDALLRDWCSPAAAAEEPQPSVRPLGVIWLPHADDRPAPEDLPTAATALDCSGLLQLVAALGRREIKELPRGLQIVTLGAQATPAEDGSAGSSPAVHPQHTQYWGLGRVIGAEQPHLGCRLIDLDPRQQDAAEAAAALGDVILNDTPENQLALRDGQVLAPRLIALRPPPADHAWECRRDASYLVTGGLGWLGRRAGEWLAGKGAGHVVLVSRRRPGPELQAVLDEIAASGTEVHVHLADLGDPAEVERLLSRFDGELPPLRGVIHAAGLVDDALLGQQSWERFARVMSPKIRGAELLHQATLDRELDFFVLYSSVAAVLGSPGQSNYAAANAYMDGLAWRRRQAGLPALSVNWGPWTEGMADNELILKRLALQGITPLTVAESHQALEKMLLQDVVQATVLDVDWRRMRLGLGGDTPPLLEEVAPAAAAPRSGDSELIKKLQSLQGPARKRLLVEMIQGELQQILAAAAPPDIDTPVTELGLDSLMAVEFSTRLQQQLGDDFAIAPTLLYDYPTVQAIADYLLELAGASRSEPAPAEAAPAAPAARDDQIAIIGMSCRFPGAGGLRQYWSNLLGGVDSVREIPADRWDVEKYYSPTPQAGKMYAREGGFLDDIREFDAPFFNISDLEACWLDPQHRLMLEVSWEALEDAGMAALPLADSNVGVFMGIMSQDYGELLGGIDVQIIDGFQGAGLSHSAGVGRVSYAFGFEGPCLAIDSASSSSLVAVCQAVKSLLDGNCNAALAGGVNAILTPTNSLLLSKAGMLSPDGRCKSFSAEAKGFGRGEGCGVVVLKRLRDAERDGDRVLAVIQGAAVSHNGFSGGLTTPSGRAQERVIREALDNAGLNPADVQYLEAHGTGTELGDPIELRAAAAVLGKGRPSDKPLLVGSVKANIGHLEAAGGVSGLIKAVLALRHGMIPGQLHFESPSPHIPWNQLPLRVVTEPTPWPDGDRRIAGVTALGLSGTNAHVILTAAAEPAATPVEPSREQGQRPRLMVLSARRDEALRDLAARLHEYLLEEPQASLDDFCQTLAVGRRMFEQRAACVVESREDALDALQQVARSDADDAAASPRVHLGQARSSPKIAWFFGDQDREAAVSAADLYAAEPVFQATLDRCQAAVGEGEDEMTPAEPLPQLLGQPHLESPWSDAAWFALQMGLAELWRSWGIDADLVLGTGVGQYSAACIAGVFRLEDAVRLLVARQRILVAAPVGGPDSAEDPERLDAFEHLADTLDYFPPDRPLACELTGDIVPVHRVLGGSYWRRHCQEPSRWRDALETIGRSQCDVVLELGPGPRIPAETWESAAATPLHAWSLRGGVAAEASLADALGRLFVYGATPCFAARGVGGQHRKLGLPTYPFQRSHYWITDVRKYYQPT